MGGACPGGWGCRRRWPPLLPSLHKLAARPLLLGPSRAHSCPPFACQPRPQALTHGEAQRPVGERQDVLAPFTREWHNQEESQDLQAARGAGQWGVASCGVGQLARRGVRPGGARHAPLAAGAAARCCAARAHDWDGEEHIGDDPPACERGAHLCGCQVAGSAGGRYGVASGRRAAGPRRALSVEASVWTSLSGQAPGTRLLVK